MWIKNIVRFYGNTNAPVEKVYDIEKALIISKINKTNFRSDDISSFFVNVIFVEFLVWFIILEHIVGNLHLLRTFGLFAFVYFFFIFLLFSWGRLKLAGDTLIFFEDKIVELNWLYTKKITWDKVKNIYFYKCPKRFDPKYLAQEVRGKVQKKVRQIRTESGWINIKIRTNRRKIFINTAFSHNEELQNYIKEKQGDKIKLSGTQGLPFATRQGGFLTITNGLILGPLDVGIVYILNFLILHWHEIGFQWAIKNNRGQPLTLDN